VEREPAEVTSPVATEVGNHRVKARTPQVFFARPTAALLNEEQGKADVE